MNFELSVDTESVERYLRAIWADQLPFATSLAINRSVMDAQVAQRAHQASIFHIRRKAFVMNAVKIKPFASKAALAARIWIDPPGGAARADILTKFEHDTQKFPFHGSRIAVPTEAVKRTGAGIVSKAWRPKQLHLQPEPGRPDTFVGDKNTVAFFRSGGHGGIFQRISGRLVPLYWFVPRVPIKPELQFVQTVTRTVGQRFPGNFEKAFAQAVGSARVNTGVMSALGGLAS